VTDEVDYSDYSKAELQAAADEQGVEYDDSDTKADLLQKLEDAESSDDESMETTDGGEQPAPPEGAASVPSELYPERRPTDVDVADIENPDEEYEGELHPLPNAETWVILDGSSDEVPDELDGAVAAVISWPQGQEHDSNIGVTTTFVAPEGYWTVKERGQNILLSVTQDAFKEIYYHGRPATFA